MATKKKLTAADWAKAAIHEDVTLPSGMVVDIRLPDLAAVIQSGEFPQHLLEAALGNEAAEDTQLTKEQLADAERFQNHIVLKTVVSPAIDEDLLSQIPVQDKEFLFLIGTRQRDWDALGEPIGHIQDVKKWKQFRGFLDSNSPLED